MFLVSLLGPAGAGKGTLAATLVERGMSRFEAGSTLRAWAKANDPVLDRHLAGGGMAKTDLVVRLLEDAMKQGGETWVLDGFPRNREQVDAMAAHLPDLVLVLEAPQDVLIERLLGRVTCPGCGTISQMPGDIVPCDCGSIPVRRSDDTREAILRRLELYAEQTAPGILALEQRGVRVVRLDASVSPELVEREAMGAIEEARNRVEMPPVRRGRSRG